MGRNITQSAQIERSLITALDNFGTGQVKLFTNNGTFVVPEGITVVRARCFGGGGGGYLGSNGTAGGTSSFGVFCSATGGSGGIGTTPWRGLGGTGIGGDINRTGGNGGSQSGSAPGSGGGVAGLFANGGDGGDTGNGRNGNAGGGSYFTTGAKGGDGILGKGGYYTTASADSFLATGDWINLSIDFLGCGGGGAGVLAGPTNGGGGVAGSPIPGSGAWPGGGGGGSGGAVGGGGGGGFTIKTIVVTPGDFIAVTVGARGSNGNGLAHLGASGCVVVEY